ncbi:MAG: hypothetical protein ABSG31_03405 [Tepidisphaeraceae bacterium]|jgi:hypothetical protein
MPPFFIFKQQQLNYRILWVFFNIQGAQPMPIEPIIPRTEVIQDGVRIITEGGVLDSKIPVGDGICRHFHKNGTLRCEYEKIGGQGQGLFREWHDNGQLACERTRVGSAIKEGTWRTYNRDGSLSQELEEISPNAIYGKSYVKGYRYVSVFLWNGKPMSKGRWMKKLEVAGVPKSELQRRIPPGQSKGKQSHGDGCGSYPKRAKTTKSG